MLLLLDPQVVLWWHFDDPRLGTTTQVLLASRSCQVSVACIWEVAINHRLGKLSVTPVAFCDQSIAAGAALLPVFDAQVIKTVRLLGSPRLF